MASVSISILALCAALLTSANALATPLVRTMQEHEVSAIKVAASIMDPRPDHITARNIIQRDFVSWVTREKTAAAFALTGAILGFLWVAAMIYFLIRCAGNKSRARDI